MVVGWAAVVVLPQLYRALGPTGFVLLLPRRPGLLGRSRGLRRSRSPNPVPGVFGYHEVFHACTIVGAVLHFVVIAGSCLPLAS